MHPPVQVRGLGARRPLPCGGLEEPLTCPRQSGAERARWVSPLSRTGECGMAQTVFWKLVLETQGILFNRPGESVITWFAEVSPGGYLWWGMESRTAWGNTGVASLWPRATLSPAGLCPVLCESSGRVPAHVHCIVSAGICLSPTVPCVPSPGARLCEPHLSPLSRPPFPSLCMTPP